MQLSSALKRLAFSLRTQGFRYAYNSIYFRIFWGFIRKHQRLINLLNRLAPHPSFIEVEVTTRCNLKCIMCEHTYWSEPNREMTFEQFKNIIDQFPRLKWIGLTGIGESFLNKDFMKMLRYVKSKGVIVELYDTFFFIDKKFAQELINLKVDRIFGSIDAATKETYERIRVGSDFERVIKNVSDLFQLKKKNGAHFPEISFHYIINKHNVHELFQYVDLIGSIAKGEEVTIQFTRMLHEFKEVKDLFMEIPEDTRKAAEDKARSFGIKLIWNADVPQTKPLMSRCIEWTMPFIFVTGHVIPCCAGNEAGNRNFQKENAMGNILDQSFREIWQGAKYKNLRRTIREGRAPLPCKNCCLYSLEDSSSCAS